MKKKLILFTAITTILTLTQIKCESTNKVTKAETAPTFLAAPKIAVGDEVIFATLGCSTSDYTGGFVMAKDNEKGYTSKPVAFSGIDIDPTSENTFTVVQGYESGTIAFKLGNQYLRADNSTTKFKQHNGNISATVDPYEASCVLTYPYKFNDLIIDLDITFISDGEEWLINSAFGYNGDEGYIIYEGLGIEVENGTFTIDSLTYYLMSGYSFNAPNLTTSYTINGLTISVPDPNQEEEIVDQEASWTYEFDEISGLSYVKSCLNNKFLTYKDGKFKMDSSYSGIDVFYNISKNASIHTPTSISIDTDSISLEVVQGNSWNWTGIVVKANYAGGVVDKVLPLGGFNITLPNTNSVGKKTIKVSLYNLEKTFEITVKEKPAEKVELVGLSFSDYQTQYIVGDEFNYDVKITVHYKGKDDHVLTDDEIESRVTFQIPNLSKRGTNRAVQVGYWEIIDDVKQEIKIGQGFNYYVNIVDIPYVLDSITANLKDDVHLFGGDKFDKKNVKVTAISKANGYDDFPEIVTDFEVTSDFNLSNSMSEGEHEFNVSYTKDGKTVTCSFSATVEHKPVIESYEIVANDGFVGTSYDVTNNVVVTRVYDTGDKEPAENVIVNINDLNTIKNSKVPQQQTIRISADGKEIETKTINLIFAPVNSFSLKYESSKDGAKIGDSQQLYIKKVNNEPSLENADWMNPLTERSQKYLERFTFTSKNTSIATVDENGFVTYVGNGITEIEVAPKSGNAPSFAYSVVVGGPYPGSFRFASENVKVKIGENVTLNCNILPNDTNLSGISWESSDTNVATVDANGIVHGVADGVAIITISDSFTGKSANCGVVVKKAFPSEITLNADSKNLTVGEEFNLSAIVIPAQDVSQSVTFASENENVATVDTNGKIRAVAKGSTTITVTSVEDSSISATFNVVVSDPIVLATEIVLNNNSISLKVNETSHIDVTIKPENSTNKNVTFSSSDSSVVSVDNFGNIVALKEGDAIITVTSVSNPSISINCGITVEKENNGDGSKGCSSSIVSVSIGVSSLCLIAISLLLLKKKEYKIIEK